MKNKKAQENSQAGFGILIKITLIAALFIFLFFGLRWVLKYITMR
jgi:hypothetical protein